MNLLSVNLKLLRRGNSLVLSRTDNCQTSSTDQTWRKSLLLLLQDGKSVGRGEGRKAPSAVRKMTLSVDPEKALRLCDFESVEEDFALKRRHVAVSEVLQQDLNGHVTGCECRLGKKGKTKLEVK